MKFSRRRLLGAATAAAGWATGLAGCGPTTRTMAGAIVGAPHALGHRLREALSGPVVPGDSIGVLIVGGGVSGLAAAWKLWRSGYRDVAVLEMDSRCGGTSSFGESPVTAYPWGAHYLPLPSKESRAVHELLTEMGTIEGLDASGNPIYSERHLCAAPHERLYIHGKWSPGLFPSLGASQRDLDQLDRFRDLMAKFRGHRDGDGRPAFAIPVELSSPDPELRHLDQISMLAYLDQNGFDSPRLRWYVEYACRDDYGCDLATTSAWAGIHYYAARAGGEDNQVLTWHEGNGHLVRHMQGVVAPTIRPGQMAARVRAGRDHVEVDVLDALSGTMRRWKAKQVIMAVPKFVARRLLVADYATPSQWEAFTYSPWLVANLHVDELPEGPGAAISWDNVLYDSPGLGYIVATHQHVASHPGRSVLTYYRPFCSEEPARTRARMLATPWPDWRDQVLGDLGSAHRNLARITERLDVMLWGHAMVRPTVGFLWGQERQALALGRDGILMAHCDTSGLPLFEEAQYRGVLCAEQAMTHLGHDHKSSL